MPDNDLTYGELVDAYVDLNTRVRKGEARLEDQLALAARMNELRKEIGKRRDAGLGPDDEVYDAKAKEFIDFDADPNSPPGR